MDLSLLEQLKQKLVREKDLSRVWNYYMDHFADHQAFIEQGEPVRHSLLENIIAEVGKQIFRQSFVIEGLVLIQIPQHQFIHAAFNIKGCIGGAIYFEDQQVGLIAIADPPPSKQVKYARVSGHQLQRPKNPSYN